MNHYKQILYAVFFVLFALTACEKDPFEGVDNFLFDFSLQDGDGNIFDGKITDNIVQFSIPANIDLAKLTPKYRISELATISPKPESVKDWSAEQTFTVTSHSGSQRMYSVKVEREEVELNENVNLRTEEDVAAFAARKIDVINGNLTIGAPSGTDSIANIDALAGLKEVRYKLIVNPTFKGELKALGNLESIGSLTINGTPEGLSEITLPKLKYIQNVFSSQSNNINRISLPALVSAGNISVTSVQLTEMALPELKEAEVIDCRLPFLDELNVRSLETINTLLLDGTTLYSDPQKPTPTIKKIAFPRLKEVGEMRVSTLKELESIELSALVQAGSISLSNLPVVTSIKLDALKVVESKLYAESNSSSYNKVLQLFHAPLLESVGDINLQAFTVLKSVKLPMLKFADGFRITPSVENWEVPKLEEVNHLNCYNYVPSFFENLSRINKLDINESSYEGEADLSHIQIDGDITIIRCFGFRKITLPQKISSFELNYASNSSATQLPEITGLEECENFSIRNAPGVTEVVLPVSLKKVNQQLYFYGGALSVVGENLQEVGEINISSNNLASMSFPNLENVTGRLRLFGKFLETIHLPKINTVGRLEIGGSYSGWQNEKLTNVGFLSTLSSVETLEIKFCKFLTDYSGFKRAVESGGITESIWNERTVHSNAYNPTFDDLKAGRYVKED